jgi:hypothetical protein
MFFFSPVLFPVLYVTRCRTFGILPIISEEIESKFAAKYTLRKPVFVYYKQLMPMDCKKILHV